MGGGPAPSSIHHLLVCLEERRDLPGKLLHFPISGRGRGEKSLISSSSFLLNRGFFFLLFEGSIEGEGFSSS